MTTMKWPHQRKVAFLKRLEGSQRHSSSSSSSSSCSGLVSQATTATTRTTTTTTTSIPSLSTMNNCHLRRQNCQHYSSNSISSKRSGANAVAASSSLSVSSLSSSNHAGGVPAWPVLQQTQSQKPQHHHQQQHRALDNNHMDNRRRFVSSSSSSSPSSKSLSSVSTWLKDVIRTGSLSPPNPILISLKDSMTIHSSSSTDESGIDNDIRRSSIPKFRHVSPYHLTSATNEVREQFQIDLATLEVNLTKVVNDDDEDENNNNNNISHIGGGTVADLLLEMERIQAPVQHLIEVAELYSTLAATPDLLDEWDAATTETISVLSNLELQVYRSKILYESLHQRQRDQIGSSMATTTKTMIPPSIEHRFQQQGVHLIATWSSNSSEPISSHNEPVEQEQDELDTLERQEQLQQIDDQLRTIHNRLSKVDNYDSASKASRLQCVSDMYNCIGLSQLQSKILGYETVVDMSRSIHGHIVDGSDGTDDKTDTNDNNNAKTTEKSITETEQPSPIPPSIQTMFDEIGNYLHPFLPHQVKLNLDIVGTFLGDESKKPQGAKSTSGGPTEEQRTLFEARYKLKQNLRFHGVVQGMVDFCDSILGLRIDVVSTSPNNEGWNKNVRLLHIYQKVPSDSQSPDNPDITSSDQGEKYLGTIYLDPFRDNYFRSDDAKELVMTRSLAKNSFQTSAPVAVVALRIAPTWDNDPAPMSWDDLREFLFQFGKGLQLILTQNAQRSNVGLTIPPDSSDVLAHFMEMWIQNDGFLHRLVHLSQDPNKDPVSLEEEELQTMRKDLKKTKALEIMNTVFLSALQLEAFGRFDPRGDETLMALQTRLAQQYLPKGNLPDSTDLSPLLAVFQETGVQSTISAIGPILSEVLAAMLYETFQKTDLRDRAKVERLGGGIRDLFGEVQNQADRSPSPVLLTLNEIETLCDTRLSAGQLKRVWKFDEVDDQPDNESQQ